MKYLVSACLAGHSCSYDGLPRTCAVVERLVREGRAVPVCPECLGGLPVPRPASEIQGGTGVDVLEGRARVVNCKGEDVTGAFIRGARAVLEIARNHGIRAAILKARSPSCGYGRIYDGSFSGKVKTGHGVTAALLVESGFQIFTEEDVEKEWPAHGAGWPGENVIV
ncbi:uncharacterized protein YbbK (DUF523 family) [Desulfofundulus luciae]|uniref:Uncharacterized protein YbbK (DUF523 family) n=1 Tax=Desulfofundulus luciae TaxID=74702 RepID=A0ABU0B5Q2_9FIRM|nr:DUF523 domain-containing protein [Desulfofundulus luciae]MDQ0287604.1 uncharacterized protein YbbK (DUF523 family) [Desulfofundulus luciae]